MVGLVLFCSLFLLFVLDIEKFGVFSVIVKEKFCLGLVVGS